MAAEIGNSEFPAGKREKQQITVPFCWEEKPGRPKRDWSLNNSAPSRPVPSSSTTFAPSVPFKWEEKPGTPLREFTEAAAPTPLRSSLIYPAIPTSPGGYCKDECKGRSNPFVDDDERSGSFQPDDVTVLSPFDTEKSESNENPSEISGKCETWDSDSTSETGDLDSESSGSATRKSAEEVSVLEFLFPLSSPEVSFLTAAWCREKANAGSHLDSDTKNSKIQCVSAAKRGSTTLGELIVLSRKLSRARQNPIPGRKQGFRLVRWQELVRKRVHACGLFGSSINPAITLDASS